MTECVLIRNRPRKDGYVRISRGGKPWYAHVYYYVQKYGSLAPGLEIDHLCGNRACTNTDHLEAVSHKVNMERSRNHVHRTGLCRKGHVLKDAGIYIHPKTGPTCLACKREGLRRWRRKQGGLIKI